MQTSCPRYAQTAVTRTHHAAGVMIGRWWQCDGVERLPHGRTRHGVQRARSLVVFSPVFVFELEEPRFSLGIDQEVPQG